MLDGVVDVVRRHLDRQPDPVLRQLLDLGLHAVHSSRERTGEVERSRHVSAWNLSLLGLAGAIWIAIFSAMAYALRVRACRLRECGREDSNLQGPRGPTGPKPVASASFATPARSRIGRRDSPTDENSTRVAPCGGNAARGRLCADERRRPAPFSRRPARRLRRQPDRPRGERLSLRRSGWRRLDGSEEPRQFTVRRAERQLSPLVSRRTLARVRLDSRRRGREEGARRALRPAGRRRRAAPADRRQGVRRVDRLVARLDAASPSRAACATRRTRRRTSAGAPPRRFDRVFYKLDSVGWTGDRRKHVFVVGLDGGDERQLTDGDCEDGEPAWSSDGRTHRLRLHARRALGRRARRSAVRARGRRRGSRAATADPARRVGQPGRRSRPTGRESPTRTRLRTARSRTTARSP